MTAAAQELQREAYVFDFVPQGEPFVETPAITAVIDEHLERTAPLPEVMRAIVNAKVAELEESPDARDQVAECWDRSGVNGVLLTLGGLGFSHDWEVVLRDIAYWTRRACVGDLAICRTPDDLLAAAERRQVGIVLGTQDSSMIGSDIGRLELLHDFGVRVMQLTYNTRNLIGDGCTERNPAGLSKFGLSVVDRFNELGIVVDLSHSSDPTSLDAIEHSARPVAITHASCRSVAEHPRGKTDEVLKALGARDGYVGINAVPFFIAPDGGASVEVLAEHVLHAAELVGIERVGIGTDWGPQSPDFPRRIVEMARNALARHGFSNSELPPFGAPVEGLGAWEDWPNITGALLSRGLSVAEVRGIIGGNWLAFLRRAGL